MTDKIDDSGKKYDEGKNRLGLVILGFARALTEVGKVGTYGAGKYADDGWMSVPDGERRYTDAMLRHLLAEASGEEIDQESGLLHSAQVAWNALARLDLALRDGESKCGAPTDYKSTGDTPTDTKAAEEEWFIRKTGYCRYVSDCVS